MPKSNVTAKASTIKLSDMQRALLIAAAEHEDRCLFRPETLRGAQAAKLGEALFAAGYVREVKAKNASRPWRQDGKTGTAFALKLTAAGAKAIAAENATAMNAIGAASPSAAQVTDDAMSVKGAAEKRADAVRPAAPGTARTEPRAASKIATVIGLLSRAEGATLAELIAATDWLPHTTRAALTGLRKRGYALTLDRDDRQRGSVYRITAQPSGETPKPTERASEAA